jgi:hypothetical protein
MLSNLTEHTGVISITRFFFWRGGGYGSDFNVYLRLSKNTVHETGVCLIQIISCF